MIEPILAAAAALAPLQEPAGHAPVPVPSVRIWDRAPHNAFTDLIRFERRFYCTFREASGHVPGKSGADGTIRVIASEDGEAWESAALLEVEGIDLRDPKLSITPDGRLMALLGGSHYEAGEILDRLPRVSFSDAEGAGFCEPIEVEMDPAIAGPNDWLWRVTWREGVAWGVVYQAVSEEWGLHLVRSADGIRYEQVSPLDLDGRPNEATIRFLGDGEMLMVVRREGGDRRGALGRARPPYRDWSWSPIDRRLGGPDLALLPDGGLVLGTRRYREKAYTTVLGRLGLDGSFERRLELPSGGDTSYPGLLVHGEHLWVSYYSSHEPGVGTAIYLAKVPLEVLAE